MIYPSQHHDLFSFADLDTWFQTGSEVPPSEGNSPQNLVLVMIRKIRRGTPAQDADDFDVESAVEPSNNNNMEPLQLSQDDEIDVVVID